VTGNDALEALLARLAASYGGAAFFDLAELRAWPKAAVSTLKKCKLLTEAAPANSVTCNGCEQQCHMPVEIIGGTSRSAAFVVCDKRDDINRVDVPLERLDRWQASGEAVAAFLALTLGITRSLGVATQGRRWDVGVLRGKHAAHLVLTNTDVLTLELAGHAVPLVEVLSLRGRRLELRRETLIDCVDHPAAGGGARESGEQRALRIARQCERWKALGHRNFRVIVAREEGLSVETIKKLLARAKSVARPSS
jgi:hypothetical protein